MTEQKETALPKLEEHLCFAVYGAAHAFTRAYKPLLSPLGLTYPQYVVMLTLWDEDGVAVKQLGERVGLDSGTLSPLLKRLEQIGYVARRRGQPDERNVLIFLTEKGRALHGSAREVLEGIGAQIGCSREDIASLRDAILKLKMSLDKQN